jgi:hypothetical protein
VCAVVNPHYRDFYAVLFRHFSAVYVNRRGPGESRMPLFLRANLCMGPEMCRIVYSWVDRAAR